MKRHSRRVLIGGIAGLASSVMLVVTLAKPGASIALGILVGAVFGLAFRPVARAYADSTMTAAALAIPIWALLSVLAFPLIGGHSPRWSAGEMRLLVPELVGWVLYGATLGLILQALNDLALAIFGPEPEPPPPSQVDKVRVVILGGGFAGMTTAESLERLLKADPRIEVTLVSENNALLFTPMLAEVAGSSLEPTHISSPLRTSLRLTRVIRGRVARIDLANRRIALALEGSSEGGSAQELGYDHLVLALGSVSNYLGMQSVQERAFDFKTLLDAIRIRNHVIDMFERADREPDPDKRRELLTFVVAGGGFAGVELAGALNDFARGILPEYLSLPAAELRIILVHSRDRILPELSARLGAYALERMTARGVEFILGKRLADATPGAVVLNSGEVIRAQTLAWTAGTAPNPLLRTLPVELDKRGSVIVDSTLAVPGQPGLWALGDCAAVVDAKTGKSCPPTAQFALREGRVLAHNICAAINGTPPRDFCFNSLGALCVVGHQTACAELVVPFSGGKTLRFSGLLAWLMWRSIYLSKLPGLERKVRVLVDWVIELFFPRDIVQTIDLSSAAAETKKQAASGH